MKIVIGLFILAVVIITFAVSKKNASKADEAEEIRKKAIEVYDKSYSGNPFDFSKSRIKEDQKENEGN